MKFLLAAVTALVVFTADGRHFRDEPGEQLGKTDEAQLFFPDGTDGHGGLQYSPNGPKPDHQLEMKTKQHERKSQKPKCKRSDVCGVMGGICVTNATLCDGRLVPEGCKGNKCQCCVPGTIKANFDKLEKSLNDSLNSQLQSLKESIDIKLQSMGDTINASKVDLGRMNIELQSMGDDLNASKADLGSMDRKLQSMGDNLNASEVDLGSIDRKLQSMGDNINASKVDLGSMDRKLQSMGDNLNASKVDLGSIDIELQSIGDTLNASKADLGIMNIELQSMGDNLNASKVDLGNMNIELQSMGDNINASKVDLGSINIELQSMGDNLNASKSDLNSMNIGLQSMGDTLNASKADLDSEFHSLTLNLNSSFSKLNSKIDSLPTMHDCPRDLFRVNGTNQCFKFFTDMPRSYTASKSKCESEGLLMAKPNHPLELRRYMVNLYGAKPAWLGARGTGSDIKWDRDGSIISSSDSLWWPGQSSYTSTSYCLEFLSRQSNIDRYPNSPYHMYSCASASWYALCEYSR